MVANKPGSTVTTDCKDSTTVPPGPIQAKKVTLVSPVGYHNWDPIYKNIELQDNSYIPDFATKINLPNSSVNLAPNINFTVELLSKWFNSYGDDPAHTFYPWVYVNKTVYVDGTVIGSAINISLTPGVPHREEYEITPGLPLGLHWIEVEITNYIVWVCPNGAVMYWLWSHEQIVLYLWVTISADIAASTWYDQAYNGAYSTTLYKSQLPTADFHVDGRDIIAAARAFMTFPGDARWTSTADIVKDYKVDGRDIVAIARMFGWPERLGWTWPTPIPPMPSSPIPIWPIFL